MRKSRVKPRRVDELDSVAYGKARSGNRRTFELLMEAQGYWSEMDRFRRERKRNKDYTFGDQWGDIICVDGKSMREEDYIKGQGNLPLVTNTLSPGSSSSFSVSIAARRRSRCAWPGTGTSRSLGRP